MPNCQGGCRDAIYRVSTLYSLAEEKYQLPVYPILVNLLKPDRKRPIPTRYESEFGGMKAGGEYKVINLWEIEVQTILNRPIRALIPFVPLLKGGNDAIVVREAQKILRADQQLQDFETLLIFFASFVLDTNIVQQILRWDMAILEASPFYQELRKTVFQEGIEQGLEQGLERGRLEAQQQERRKTVEILLQLRFGTIDPELEAIVPKLMALSTEEFSPLILQRSREYLRERIYR